MIRAVSQTLTILLDSIDTDLTDTLAVEVSLLICLLIAWVLLYFLNFHIYYKRLRDEIWQTNGMVNLLPFHTVLENEEIYKRVISWGDY